MRPILADRDQIRQRLHDEFFDLVIVGGGINGAAVARDASMRGLKVALLEQNDFGFGTSSRSTRLIHGGIRYLEHGELALVFESVSERYLLSLLARHLVRPLPFVLPVERGGDNGLKLNIGLWLYDGLALFRNYRHHRRLSPTAVTELASTLDVSRLKSALLYYDYQTDDALMVLENILSAIELGAAAISYARIEGFDKEGVRVSVAHVHDTVTGERFSVRSRAILCTTGPWTDQVLSLAGNNVSLLRPTKGVHIVIPREKFPLDAALVLRHPADQRILFALPYYERTVVGTTDTDFNEDPSSVRATTKDVLYLFSAVKHYSPKTTLSLTDVIATWAGVRPLLRTSLQEGPSSLSRRDAIGRRPDGVFFVVGGKLTTYRKMAAKTVDLIVQELVRQNASFNYGRSRTHMVRLPGAASISSEQDLQALKKDLFREVGVRDIAEHLAHTYGCRAQMLVSITQDRPSLLERIDVELPYIWAEIVFAATNGFALTLADTLVRRTKIFYRARDQGTACVERAADLMAEVLGWTSEERFRQRASFDEIVKNENSWRCEFENNSSNTIDAVQKHGNATG